MTPQKFYQELEDRGISLTEISKMYRERYGVSSDMYAYKRQNGIPSIKFLKIIRELTDDDFIYDSALQKCEYMGKKNLLELEDFLYDLKASKAKIMEIRMRRKAQRKML
ncbi:hypothetical protein [Lactococcus lactis]|uniref:DUF7339 family protein n=1 Tax=Lactococcus lactis TaxID=1358 RepID=UPI00288F2911|nr:hypothetical protein [Lactococcus lactis]MDT2909118.1 hypothetical protein [Lactococcus lactis]MDT2925043.1 hypothetical protein [Lactococcus lactis]MDT2951889.1 hypothetical protein [Lactococcus lactis]